MAIFVIHIIHHQLLFISCKFFNKFFYFFIFFKIIYITTTFTAAFFTYLYSWQFIFGLNSKVFWLSTYYINFFEFIFYCLYKCCCFFNKFLNITLINSTWNNIFTRFIYNIIYRNIYSFLLKFHYWLWQSIKFFSVNIKSSL